MRRVLLSVKLSSMPRCTKQEEATPIDLSGVQSRFQQARRTCLAAIIFSATILNAALADETDSVSEKSGHPPSHNIVEKDESGPDTGPAKGTPSQSGEQNMTMDQYLDRLMMAESGGHTFARSTTSTATGPFQFIASTWLGVIRSYFPEQHERLTAKQILDLRTDLKLARKAAELYTIENARFLKERNTEASFINLRIAFLVGPTAAVRVLSASLDTKVHRLLRPLALRANPALGKMTVKQLIARAAQDLMVTGNQTTGPDIPAGKHQAAGRRRKPAIKIRCNLARPSCRRWLSLKKKRLRRINRRAQQAKK